MRKIGSEIAAGISIFLAIIIFIGGFLFLKNVAFKAGTYNFIIRFDDITGLERHDPVSVSGLRVGKVVGFRLASTKVLVEVEVSPDVELASDSHAEINSLGMVGEKYIDIVPGTAPVFLKDGDTIDGSTASDLSEISGTVEGLMEQAEALLIEIKSTFENVFDSATQRNVKESLLHLRNLSSALDRNVSHLEQTLVNLDEISSHTNELLASRKEKVGTSIDNLAAASEKLGGLTDKLDRSLSSAQTLLSRIENQEGAVGKVIASDELYNDLMTLTTDLDELVKDLKKHPQKYLDLGFIKIF